MQLVVAFEPGIQYVPAEQIVGNPETQNDPPGHVTGQLPWRHRSLLWQVVGADDPATQTDPAGQIIGTDTEAGQ